MNRKRINKTAFVFIVILSLLFFMRIKEIEAVSQETDISLTILQEDSEPDEMVPEANVIEKNLNQDNDWDVIPQTGLSSHSLGVNIGLVLIIIGSVFIINSKGKDNNYEVL